MKCRSTSKANTRTDLWAQPLPVVLFQGQTDVVEPVRESNLSLILAVVKFDVTRGFQDRTSPSCGNVKNAAWAAAGD
jgi:hypothetical protein